MHIPEYKRPEGEFAYLVRREFIPVKQPPIEQISLFPTIEDDIYQNIQQLLKKFKKHKARIKNIANKYNIDEKAAKKYYEAALQKFIHKLNYEHYLRNKEYLEWMYTPEAQTYFRQYIQECDERVRRYEQEFKQRITQGKEHVVSIIINDPELSKLLDNPAFSKINYHGPFSSLLNIPGITEHDTKILLARGYIQIEQGDPDTILKYNFPAKKEENTNRFVCIECGIELDYNDIGLNKKLGAKDERFYKCPRCLGMTEEEEESTIRFYRSSGCNMFI
ncbi:MAG TPA: hypothetical protein GXX35_11355 [Thermoanaerobacterales bacterium]|nr:hypothetical protein [Thermoanaerobacterales bacterium]